MSSSLEEIKFNPNWEYASFSKINKGSSFLYKTLKDSKNKIIAVNAGHGTKNGSSIKTLCHPDGTPKTTGGSTKKGSTHALAVSDGITLLNGITEGAINLKVAKKLKEILLNNGYNVLMIRDDEDVQLDNIARTVIANNISDILISLHFDSGDKNKGAFYLSVPDAIKEMTPVKEHWKEHDKLGKNIIEGLKKNNVKIFGEGKMDIDLTQTCYSTIPSIIVELGDQATNVEDEELNKMVEGILNGIDIFFS